MSRDADSPNSGVYGDGDRASAARDAFATSGGADRLTDVLFGSTSECYLVIDERNRIAFANAAVADVFGYEPADVVDELLFELIPDRLCESHRAGFERYLQTGERTMQWDDVELTGRHRDGREIPLRASFRQFDHEGENYLVGVLRDESDRVDRLDRLSTERAFVESVFDALPDLVYAFDEDGQFLRWNDRLTEVTGYSDEEVASMEPLSFVPEADHDCVAAAIHDVLTERSVETVESRLVTEDGTEIPYEFTGAPLVEDGEVVGFTGVGRDVSDRKQRERLLERLADLNRVIRSVDRALVEASTRDEITRTVCDRLVDEGAYRGAVIGTVGDDGFRADAIANVGDTSIDPCDQDERAVPCSAASDAVDSHSIELIDAASDTVPEPWRRDARERGGGTIAAVPLIADDQSFGVLCVYSGRAEGLSDRERRVLDELGRSVGQAVQSALTEQLLYADVVTEIELESTDPSLAFVDVSAAAGCRLDLERLVTFGETSVHCIRAAGASPEHIRAAASANPSIESADYLDGDDDRHSFEFRTPSGTITSILESRGAMTTDGEAENGTARIVAELPPDVDVREVVDAVTSVYPETELVARRKVERSPRTPVEFRRQVADELTDKQRGALEAAYFGGYFEWPTRASDARAVAETIGVAPQTFHQHFRFAQRKLLEALFEPENGTARGANT